jgi:5-methylcytosine-specific restriction enzyme subunit McrC
MEFTKQKLIQLAEEEPSPEMLTAEERDDLRRKYGKQLEIRPTDESGCYEIRSRGFVGHLPVSKSFTVSVAPKLPVSNIFGMLEYAYDLKSFELFKGQIAVETLNDLYEGLASILAKRVLDRARKGLYCSYVEETAKLQFVRGRIRIAETLQSLILGSIALCCEYEDHTADLDENRILLWTLFSLRKLYFVNSELHKQVKRAYQALAGSITLEQKDAADCFGRQYHRLNDDYQPMHMLCGVFLEHLGPGLLAGEGRFLPFMLSMPKLFERFVARWLSSRLTEEIRVAESHPVRVDLSYKTGEAGAKTFKMDIVLRDKADNALAVIDTKYKSDEKPDDDDIHQVVSYAHLMSTQNAILVYPSAKTKPMSFLMNDILVKVMTFDISRQDLGGNAFLNELNKALGL